MNREEILHTIDSAEILCVGTELLIGQTLNTNAHFLAGELSLLGISSYYQTVVGDNRKRLEEAIRQAAKRSDCVLLTGGLGPTTDDITMEMGARAAGVPLERHEPTVEALKKIFSRAGREMTPNNMKQSLLPKGGHVLPNGNGTAPGCILETEVAGHHSVLVLLPGPPSELRPMFLEQVRPYLRKRTRRVLRNVFVRMIGIGESAAETKLRDLIDRQTNPTLAPYAGEGEVLFRITQLADDEQEPDNTGPLLQEIRNRVGSYIYEIGERKMNEVLADLLRERGLTLSLAESCTAGMAASSLADVPGASAVLTGGIVAYGNEAKKTLLHVDPNILAVHGAVSEPCAAAMAEGCRTAFGSDLAVSITGVAGPDGGTEEKPVGTVCMAVAGPDGTQTQTFHFFGNRARIRRASALHALNLVRRSVLA